MKIELYGINGINKGAELMMASMIEMVNSWGGTHSLSVNYAHYKTFDRGKYPIRRLLYYPTKRSFFLSDVFVRIGNLIPEFLHRYLGTESVSNIDVVLDASGFVYSDQWDVSAIRVSSEHFMHVKKNGGKVIMMPQALGPFNEPYSATLMKELLLNVDICFARDEVSMRHLEELNTETKIHKYPDFTNLLHVHSNNDNEAPSTIHEFVVIPNLRMVDKGGCELEAYISFLKEIFFYGRAKGLVGILIVHDISGDQIFIDPLREHFADKLKILEVRDALEVKRVIGNARFCISSRFHGLVSALAQGVPIIATGWSHKYKMLLRDYEMEHFIVEDIKDISKLTECLDRLSDDASYSMTRKSIVENGDKQKQQSCEMWRIVKELILK